MEHDRIDGHSTIDGAGTSARIVRFSIGGRVFGIEFGEISGLSEPGTVCEVPGAAAAIAGIADWRGRIVTVVDLRRLLGSPPRRVPGPCSWLRLASPRDHLVLRVDGAVALSQPARAIEIGRPAGGAGFVRPCVRDGESIELLDPQALSRSLESAQRLAGGATGANHGAA